jgi:sodium/proline symporter
MSLYWRRMNQWGALAGIVVGGITVVAWAEMSGGLFDLYEIVPGVIFAYIAIVVVSLMTAEPSKEITEQFDTLEDA